MGEKAEDSMYNIIDDKTKVSETDWGAFVLEHPDGNIFQSPDIVRFYEATGEYKPVTLFSIDKSGKVAGIVVAYIIRDGKFLTRQLSSRAIIAGGPLIKKGEEQSANALISEIKRRTTGKVNYIQVRNLFSASGLTDKFIGNGFVYEDHLNVLIDLTKNTEVLQSELHPSRRKQIGRAIRRGVEIVMPEKPDRIILDACYSILSSVYEKAGLPLPSSLFFYEAFHVLEAIKRLKLFLAIYNGSIIAFRYVLMYKDVIYDWFAGSATEYNDKYPNDILPWSIIQWGKEQGFKTFDFGGAGHPDEQYGVRDYKIKFGGSMVNFGRYIYVSRPLIYYPAKYYLKLKKQ